MIETLCKEVKTATKGGEVCQIANHLFPNGFSVSGHSEALTALEAKATDAGALQAKMLKTSGDFHTPLMQGAKDHLLSQLQAHKPSMGPPRCTVYMNTTARAIGPETSPDEIIQMLGQQLVSPVLWRQSMELAIQDGCKEFYECGPSKQLRAMMKRIDPKTAEKMTNVLA